MDGVNLAAFTENAARLGMRIQETLHEHTRDLTITRGGASLFDMPDDKNIGRQLEFGSDREKLEAMKRLIALTSKGRNVSNYFPQVVKNVASQNLEIRKLVYIYLLRYAEREPDLALLSINAFQKDLTDPSPLIRAMALRVLSGIKVPMIASIVVLAVKKCAADLSPYVRKAAGLAIPKTYRLDPSQQATLIPIISSLLRDRSPLSIGSAVIAFEAVDLLNLLLRYARTMLPKPTMSRDGESEVEELDEDLRLLLSSAEPLFQSRIPAVVLAAVRVFYYTGISSSLRKIVNPLLRILNTSKETERVVLSYISVATYEHPFLFSSQYARLLIRTSDPQQVKKDKIKVLLNLCNIDNHQALLREFIDYADDPDDVVVADSVHAIDAIVSNAILVLKSLVQNQLLSDPITKGLPSQSPLTIISQLARRIDDIRHPRARACVIWLTGQYSPARGESTAIEGISDWAPDVLRKVTRSFNAEDVIVKTQTLTLAAKLFILYDANYDVRDRTRMLTSLLSGVSPLFNGQPLDDQIGGVVLRTEQVKKVLFDGKAGIVDDDDYAATLLARLA
ncbi:hypothetical protein ID866_2724 [Astraeus odoratus]|nr:hypothetical protein ID866_2724 [Astraeus odoratus]